MVEQLTIEQKKAILEEAGWKIFIHTDDNRSDWWRYGVAITPDGFEAKSRSYSHSSNEYDSDGLNETDLDEMYETMDREYEKEAQKILEEIVNKAWARYQKDNS